MSRPFERFLRSDLHRWLRLALLLVGVIVLSITCHLPRAAGWVCSSTALKSLSASSSIVRTQPLLTSERQPRGSSQNSHRSFRKELVTLSSTEEKRADAEVAAQSGHQGGNGSKTSSNRITERRYDLGLGKNKPKQEDSEENAISTPPVFRNDSENGIKVAASNDDTGSTTTTTGILGAPAFAQNWMVPESVIKPTAASFPPMLASTGTTTTNGQANVAAVAISPSSEQATPQRAGVTTRRMVARDNDSQLLRGALWDERHYDGINGDADSGATTSGSDSRSTTASPSIPKTTVYRSSSSEDDADSASIDSHTIAGQSAANNRANNNAPPYPKAFYPDIDLSIPDSVYTDDGSVDLVWDLMRWEVYQNQQQQYEPLLVSFLHSSILNHDSLESSLAFLLANRLQSPAMMISTQLQALILSALQECPSYRRKVRADIMAVRDRDPACHTLPDVFLYFKGFHALQSHRAAHVLWNTQRTVLAQYLQSQVSQIFQIDIHPNATIGSGIMLDHGTGIVIGETATVGHNCSILHHVTLGGSGKKGVVRHPAVGNGVLLGAGATVLGPVTIGDGSQVGAGTLVISDLPAHCVAVGVPARIIGSFVDVTEQPSIGMNQIMEDQGNMVTFESEGI